MYKLKFLLKVNGCLNNGEGINVKTKKGDRIESPCALMTGN